MVKYGEIITAVVTDENEKEYYVQNEGITYALDKTEVEDNLNNGDEVEGMIYETQTGKMVIQVNLPDIRPNYYGWGTVVTVRKDLGVFVDVGLNNKEVVVSLDDLPLINNLWPKKGNRLYLSYSVDDRNRFWGHMADTETMADLFIKAPLRLKNQDITATVYQLKMAGSLAITEEGFNAFLHESERQAEPRLGDVIHGRVIGVRTDGGLNISLNPRAHEVIDDDAKMLIAVLQKTPNEYLPLHDKSDPEEIKQQLGISKAQFKRAVGNLMKSSLIKQVKGDGIYLLKAEAE